jgi:hypothetical protein
MDDDKAVLHLRKVLKTLHSIVRSQDKTETERLDELNRRDPGHEYYPNMLGIQVANVADRIEKIIEQWE